MSNSYGHMVKAKAVCRKQALLTLRVFVDSSEFEL